MRLAAPTPQPASAARRLRRPRQRGMVTVVVMLFLIATVVFALSQMLNVSSGNVIDGQRQGDSTAAFFLAESGLEKGQTSYFAGLALGSVTDATCTGIASTYNLGRGSVALTGQSVACAGMACIDCTLKAVGTVGVSTRTLTRLVDLNTQQGIFCNGPVTINCRNTPAPPTWQLILNNNSAYDGVGMFNLGYIGKGNNTASCTVASHCRPQFDLGSPSAGVDSAGLMGNSVNIPAGSSYPIYQVMDRADRSLVEVGVIFKGSTAAPTLTGTANTDGAASYWNTNSSGNGTVGSTDTTGQTNDGTASSTGTCSATSANSQGCTNWCYGGDTLVFNYAAKVTNLTDALSSVSFGTGANGSQSMPMLPVAKYPVTQATGAPINVEAEIWYARNPNLVGNAPTTLNTSSYKGRGTGAVGASWPGSNSDTTQVNNGGNGNVAGNTLTVGSAFTGLYPGQIITPGAIGTGDLLSSSGGSSGNNVSCPSGVCPTILSQDSSAEPNGALGGRGTYTISGATQAISSANNRTWTVSSKLLNVSSCTICFFEANDALNAPALVSGRTITAQVTPLGTVAARGRVESTGGVGRYSTTAAGSFVQAGPAAVVQAGTPSTTVYLRYDNATAANNNLPAATTPPMRIAIKTGTGQLASNTTVSSLSAAITPNAVTRSFVLSAAPATALDDVTLCAGTCALFVPGGNTIFTLTKSAGTAEWASAFTCLKGVDMPPEPVTRSAGVLRRWTETIN